MGDVYMKKIPADAVLNHREWSHLWFLGTSEKKFTFILSDDSLPCLSFRNQLWIYVRLPQRRFIYTHIARHDSTLSGR